MYIVDDVHSSTITLDSVVLRSAGRYYCYELIVHVAFKGMV